MPPILVEFPPYNGGSLLLSVTTVVGSVGVNVSFWLGENDIVLIWFDLLILYESTAKLFLSLLVIFSFSHQSLACSLYAWWWSILQTCSSFCWILLESWILTYKEQYHINRAMVMVCRYIAQMGVIEQITWWNKCLQHVIWVEEIWEIGDRV